MRWPSFICVIGAWVPLWSDVILIWYHYIVICTLVTIFNWWLSRKDMKLQVLIKEALFSLSLTHVLYYAALLNCERASSTFFDTRDNWRIIIYIHYIMLHYFVLYYIILYYIILYYIILYYIYVYTCIYYMQSPLAVEWWLEKHHFCFLFMNK